MFLFSFSARFWHLDMNKVNKDMNNENIEELVDIWKTIGHINELPQGLKDHDRQLTNLIKTLSRELFLYLIQFLFTFLIKN